MFYQTKDNQEFDKGWKKLIKDHRSKLKEHEDKVFKELKRRLDSKMEQDKRLLTEGTFKTKNDHGTQKNLDNATYFPVYKTFIDKEFDVMYNAKRQYKGTFNQPEIHENKFKRKIKFRLWTYLLSKQQEHLTQ